MPSVNDLFPSNYLKASDIGTSDLILTISEQKMVEFDNGDKKPVILFRETDKKLTLNRTNANTIAGLYGDDTTKWIGRPIALFATEVDFKGKQVLAIRIRMRPPAADATEGSQPTITDDDIPF
jgi:hypothetical protein